jgi:response regulator of citrate/malate metabolism
MKILYLEDHPFFASDIVEYIKEETNHQLFFAKTYREATEYIIKENSFDLSILDVILQNGKTGLGFAREYKEKLGNIMFVTGCCDTATLDNLKEYIVVNKLELIFPKLKLFLDKNFDAIKEMEKTECRYAI